MSLMQPIKKIIEQIKLQKCSKRNCLSNNRGNLQVIWFGKQYENKQITCSCCYMLNDQAIKKSLPASYNVLPVLKFTDKLLDEYKIYEQRKKTANWHPLIMRQKKAQLLKQLSIFQTKLTASLSSLQTSLQNFSKKLTVRNKQIFSHQTMNQIIQMKGKQSFQGLLQKINALVQQLNYCDITKNYEFERIEIRNKKIDKEKEKIKEVVEKVQKVLDSLLGEIRKRNQSVAKI